MKKIIIGIIFITTLISCKTKINGYDETKLSFTNTYKISNILDHFPNIIKDNFASGFFNGPGNNNCFGDMFLTLFADQKLIKKIKANKFLIIKPYSDSLFLPIDIGIVRDSFTLNKSYLSKIENNFCPIAKICEVNYGLGELPDSLYFADDKKFAPINKFIVPNDLIIYVLDFKSGDYWKDSCKASRYSKLGKWRNGFSKGYAISEKLGLVTYWTVAW